MPEPGYDCDDSGLRLYRFLSPNSDWQDSGEREWLESVDPSSGQVWAKVPHATPDDVDEAVDVAGLALSGPWGSFTGEERSAALSRLADLLLADLGRLADIEARDAGIPIRMAEGDVRSAARWFRYFAGAADKIEGAAIPSNLGWHAYTRREPVGVVAAIIPWNVPLLMCAFKLAPALAAGCTVVVKPAEQTPVSAMELAVLVRAAGIPAGVVTVLQGHGSRVGAALTRHPGINKITFTGEHTTGQEIIRASAATTMGRVSVEAGGKAPHIIFADADLDKAIPVVTEAAFRRSGQACTAGTRVFVEHEVLDHVLDRMVDIAQSLPIGGALSEETVLGPQASADQLAKTMRYIAEGEEAGAHLLTGGGRPANLDPALSGGYYVEPTIFARATNDMSIAQDEIFGPVATVMGFKDEDELVRDANDVRYGLTAGMWTRDVGRAHRVAGRLVAGSVWVNVYPALHPALPYGGFKMSGHGREHGLEALDEYTETKTVVIETSGSS